ncbi:flagellar biosynthesis protein FlgA [Micromonospora coxensis]|uniref:flagellar biosynthesis protein FlgA n=1 Tax=Micromonospora coxensis TaxID=356852 RepID=UPI00342D77A2
MAGGRTGGSLGPVRRPRLPTGGTLLRAGLVAALLGLAVLVLDSGENCPAPGPAGPRPSATAPVRPSGADATEAGGRSAGGAPSGGRSPGDTPTGGPAADGPGVGGDRPGALPLPSGSVGVPVRLAEPAALAVLRPGARVDLLVVPAGGAEAVPLASGALVLDVVGGDSTDGSSALYLALGPEQARRTVGQPEGSRFTVVVRG